MCNQMTSASGTLLHWLTTGPPSCSQQDHYHVGPESAVLIHSFVPSVTLLSALSPRSLPSRLPRQVAQSHTHFLANLLRARVYTVLDQAGECRREVLTVPRLKWVFRAPEE